MDSVCNAILEFLKLIAQQDLLVFEMFVFLATRVTSKWAVRKLHCVGVNYANEPRITEFTQGKF